MSELPEFVTDYYQAARLLADGRRYAAVADLMGGRGRIIRGQLADRFGYEDGW
jgi:hypothetical protein